VTGVLAGPAAAVNAAPAPASAPTAAGAGSIGIRLVDAPVTARDDPRARVYIVDHLNPGAVIHRRVEVSNTTASTAHVARIPLPPASPRDRSSAPRRTPPTT